MENRLLTLRSPGLALPQSQRTEQEYDETQLPEQTKQNDITGGLTPASFEPSIDYIVTKIPKFAFEYIGVDPAN